MMMPLLTLSPEAIEEDGVFRHPYLVPRDYADIAEQDWLTHPGICHLPHVPSGLFLHLWRYIFLEADSEESWD